MLTPYVRLFPLLAKYFLPQPKNMDEEFLGDCYCRSESVCVLSDVVSAVNQRSVQDVPCLLPDDSRDAGGSRPSSQNKTKEEN